MSLLGPVVNGLMLGGLYGLFGLGLALAFGIMRIVNIAHGEFIVLAAYLGASLLTLTPLPVFAVVPCVCLAAFATGWLLQAAVLNRVIGPNPVPGMITTMGLSIIVRNALVMTFGANIRSIEVGSLQNKGIEILGVPVGVLPLIILAVAAMGLAIALSALAGLLLAMRSSFSPYAGVERLLVAFEVVIVGGLGSLRGCFFGGLLIGVAQVVGLNLAPDSGPLYGHLAFFVVLLARQMGLPALLAWKR